MRMIVLSAVLIAAAAPLAGPAQAAEVNVYPADSLWTGGVYYIPSWPYWGHWWQNPVTWGNFFWMTTPCSERGFARFDLSGLPDYVSVSSAVLHYHVYWDTGGPGNEFRLMNVVPLPDSDAQAQEVYDSIGSGTLVATVGSSDTGWVAVPLDSPAWRAIEEKTHTTDWFGIGWVMRDTEFFDVVADGWGPDSLGPYVTVTYELTGVAQGPRSSTSDPSLAVSPNPVTGSSVHVSHQPPVGRDAVLTIRDVLGRVVSAATLDRSGRCEIDVRGLANGVYAVRLDGGDRTVSSRMVVQR